MSPVERFEEYIRCCKTLLKIFKKGPEDEVLKAIRALHKFMMIDEESEGEAKISEAARTIAMSKSARNRRISRNAELRQIVLDRDGNRCRYCGRPVNWEDRRSAEGGTWDHIDPFGGNRPKNLVVACRGCNAKKGMRTPDQAGMSLLPAPGIAPPASADPNHFSTPDFKSRDQKSGLETGSRSEVVPAVSVAPVSTASKDSKKPHKIRETLEEYATLFKARFGNDPVINWGKDSDLAKKLLTSHGQNVSVLLQKFFQTDDEFITKSGYSFGVFYACANKLITQDVAKPVPIVKKATMAGAEAWLAMRNGKDDANGRPRLHPTDGHADRSLRGGADPGEERRLLPGPDGLRD